MNWQNRQKTERRNEREERGADGEIKRLEAAQGASSLLWGAQSCELSMLAAAQGHRKRPPKSGPWASDNLPQLPEENRSMERWHPAVRASSKSLLLSRTFLENWLMQSLALSPLKMKTVN